MSVHLNSLEAHAEERDSGRISKRAQAILDLMTGYRPITDPILTDRQIMEHLGFSDMNSVRPRVSELVKAGIFIEYDSVRDHKTGKLVRRVMRSRGQQKLF